MTETSTQAAPAPLQVRVKELEWWKPDTGDIIADCIVGRYRLGKVTANTNFRLETPSGLLERPTLDYWPEAEAKAAAQADYERRILSALDLSTPTQIAALEDENVKLRAERDEAIRQSDAVCDSYARENGQLHERAERAEAEVARLTEALTLIQTQCHPDDEEFSEPREDRRMCFSIVRDTLAALKGSTDAQA